MTADEVPAVPVDAVDPVGAVTPHEVARAARAALETALLAGDRSSAEHAVALLLAGGSSLPAVYGTVVQPLLDRVGDRRQQGRLRPAEDYLCSVAVRDLVLRLARSRPAPDGRRGLVLLLAGRGEHHGLGLMMLEQVLGDDGWAVNRPGSLPLGEAPAYLRHFRGLRVIGLSVQDLALLSGLHEELAGIRLAAPGIPVILCGLAVRRDPLLWQRLGTDGGAVDVAGAQRLIARLTNPLTDRELEVLRLAGEGRTNREIGLGLSITLSTVKAHLERVAEKVGSRDRTQSVATALRRGWLE